MAALAVYAAPAIEFPPRAGTLTRACALFFDRRHVSRENKLSDFSADLPAGLLIEAEVYAPADACHEFLIRVQR